MRRHPWGFTMRPRLWQGLFLAVLPAVDTLLPVLRDRDSGSGGPGGGSSETLARSPPADETQAPRVRCEMADARVCIFSFLLLTSGVRPCSGPSACWCAHFGFLMGYLRVWIRCPETENNFKWHFFTKVKNLCCIWVISRARVVVEKEDSSSHADGPQQPLRSEGCGLVEAAVAQNWCLC